MTLHISLGAKYNILQKYHMVPLIIIFLCIKHTLLNCIINITHAYINLIFLMNYVQHYFSVSNILFTVFTDI